jgi:hypothetical protein
LMKIMGKGKGKTRIVAVGLKNKTDLKNKQYFRKNYQINIFYVFSFNKIIFDERRAKQDYCIPG